MALLWKERWMENYFVRMVLGTRHKQQHTSITQSIDTRWRQFWFDWLYFTYTRITNQLHTQHINFKHSKKKFFFLLAKHLSAHNQWIVQYTTNEDTSNVQWTSTRRRANRTLAVSSTQPSTSTTSRRETAPPMLSARLRHRSSLYNWECVLADIVQTSASI